MRTRLTERDLNRLVKRVISEQSIKECTEGQVTTFMQNLTTKGNSPASIKNGVEGDPAGSIALTLEGFGMKCVVRKEKFGQGF